MNEEESSMERFCVGMCAVCLVVAIAAIVICCINTGAWSANSHEYQVNAVKHGAAEWRVSEDGTATFHWKEAK